MRRGAPAPKHEHSVPFVARRADPTLHIGHTLSSMFFDPAGNSAVVANQDTTNSTLTWSSTVGERSLVTALPDRMVRILVAERVEKLIPDQDAQR